MVDFPASYVRLPECNHHILDDDKPSFWFQPIGKILVNMRIFLKFRGEHKKIFETNKHSP